MKIFLSFIKPYLSIIDNGVLFRKPFSWFYATIAILNLLWPLYILLISFSNSSLMNNFFLFFLVWLFIAFAGWVSFQIWWNRMLKIEASKEDDEFVVIPIFSHFIQTSGEWFGTWISIVGFGVSLLMAIFLSGENSVSFLKETNLSFIGSFGIAGIIMFPVLGYFIILLTRFLAEQFKALAAIANNTKKD